MDIVVGNPLKQTRVSKEETTYTLFLNILKVRGFGGKVVFILVISLVSIKIQAY